jgi:CRISPR-associated endonuclease Csn1
MKKILGLDLGTASIGWALVKEDIENKGKSEIIKLGVRVNPLSTDEQKDFEKGKPLTINADRTLKRGARRNLQRFKQRRKNLIDLLITNSIIDKNISLTETGNKTTFQTLALRAKSAKEKVELDEFARVLLAINKKRGYKSSRKAKNEEEGNLIDGMSIAKELYDNNQTPGQFVYNLLKEGKKYIPEFYRSDLQNEFDKVWEFQKQHYPNILNDELYKKLQGQGKQNSSKLFLAIHQVYTAENKGKRDEVKLQHYKWRTEALKTKLKIEEVAYVLVEINNNLNKSSGYLGAISDRSKELYFKKETVGEYLYNQIKKNPHTSLKNQVFYRQDYLDEFEQIWKTQSKFHKELTNDLKEKVRDVVIFYQRKLKSQKHLISECEFEKGHKVIPKSSPLFQEFKIWQNINNIKLTNKTTHEKIRLNEDHKQLLFDELNVRGNLKNTEILNLIRYDKKEWEINFDGIQGNLTNKALFNVYQQIADFEGYGHDWAKKSAFEIYDELNEILPIIGISNKFLNFNSDIEGNDFDKQPAYQLWHLLYTAEENDSLKKKLHEKYGFKPDYANLLANVSLQQDYGSLSARAIKKILPFLKAGHEFSEACGLAGYNHSHSLTKEQLAKRELSDNLELLKKNSLRNPVVEKILNQMVNVVNQVIETYGKPDEIRIELARDLKKSAKERQQTTKGINNATKLNADIKKILQSKFGIKNPTRNDIIRYKLYEELKANGYKTIYTNQYIEPKDLFSNKIDIEHIIPKAKLFDDSFSNKTLTFRNVNLDKADTTALDYIKSKYLDDLENYKSRIELLYNNGNGTISKAKRNKLLMAEKNIPDGFIERDLRNSQYIAKKAKQMLEEVVRTVNTTTGVVTSKLRSDWDLINVMQELTLPKYKAINENLIEHIEKKDGTFKTRIKDWSKRNDHRHHAMDALTVAFTKYSHVQYYNFLNARKDESHKEHKNIIGIENKETFIDKKGKRKVIAPMPNFRDQAKKHIESILISYKNKNKVVTRNINKTKLHGKDNYHTKTQLTPRGQLHKETVYAQIKKEIVKQEKVTAKFDEAKILTVTKPAYKNALLKRLKENNNDSKKAFTGKNSLSKTPIFLNESKTKVVPEVVTTKYYEINYTIRKEITPDLFKNSKKEDIFYKKIEKENFILDKKIKTILKERYEKTKVEVDKFNKTVDKKKQNKVLDTAFSNLNKNPIWLNKEKGIQIKRVTITGVSNAEALHTKKDHFGEEILDKNGNSIPVDYVSTGNNHHVAIYKDEKGKLHEKVVSFYEAVANVNANQPVINKDYNKDKGWQFMFTMKQNEMFVFPADDFNPNDYDLLDEKNAALISKHLFRVQKISSLLSGIWFRHHLETKVEKNNDLKNITYKVIQTLTKLENVTKVRLNHLGQIVAVGEY